MHNLLSARLSRKSVCVGDILFALCGFFSFFVIFIMYLVSLNSILEESNNFLWVSICNITKNAEKETKHACRNPCICRIVHTIWNVVVPVHLPLSRTDGFSSSTTIWCIYWWKKVFYLSPLCCRSLIRHAWWLWRTLPHDFLAPCVRSAVGARATLLPLIEVKCGPVSLFPQVCYSSFIVRPPRREIDGACPPAGNLIMAPLIKHPSLRARINLLSPSSGSIIKEWRKERWREKETRTGECCGAVLLCPCYVFHKITF